MRRCSLRHRRPLGANCHKDKQRIRTAHFNLLILIKWQVLYKFFCPTLKVLHHYINSRTAVQAARLDQKGSHKPVTICTYLQIRAFPNGGNNLAATGVTANSSEFSKFPSSLKKVNSLAAELLQSFQHKSQYATTTHWQCPPPATALEKASWSMRSLGQDSKVLRYPALPAVVLHAGIKIESV